MTAPPLTLSLLIAAAYLLGAIPNGLVIARLKGIDLQKTGSGNIGATNVFRCVGKSWGVLAFVLDALKGFIPAYFFPHWVDPAPTWLGLACGIAAVAGHTWPVWLKFKGGKGVSTSAGLLLGIAPAAAGIGFGVFAVVVVLTRWVSLSSILAAIAVPVAYLWMNGAGNIPLSVALVAMSGLVIYKHRANIGRLLAGTEPRIVGRTKSA
ncbi:MAG: glycerol-3-phosphate 1-O-acyltransferase PlsY [Kiritimatiellae bacterium]|nr:glycerol-3-phosphate 1-O-acyltransferase PlsY [Kiritimatiellia bacterium]MDD4342122.1 glycerol-3-phosphate 1-O-acyltransferase PlsY [Kiritimatiellia bacterium]